ncbi:MAG: DUF7424 family protein [Pseudomonadota bacterium]
MRVFKMTAIAAAAVALAGCKTEFSTQVALSELQDPDVASVPGKVRLEVLTCEDYEDSRKPSDSLVEAQEMMPRIFPTASFSECYSQSMDSWAEFDIALPIDRDGDAETFASEDAFNITTSENLPLGVAVPPAVLNRLEQAQQANMMMGELEYAITVDVVNDTGEPFVVTALSTWVNGEPATLQPLEVPDSETISLRFSDVLIERAITTGEATVLVDLAYLGEQLRQ